MPLAAAPTVACPVRAVPVAVVLLASPPRVAPLAAGDVVRAHGTAWRLGAASLELPVPAPRRRRRKRRDSIAPRFQLPPCLYGRRIPTGGCCEGTECAGLQEDQGLEETAIVGQPTPWIWQGQPSPERGVEGGRC